MFCGSGVPLLPPSLAVVNITLLAVAVPLLVMVILATVLPLLHENTVEVLNRGLTKTLDGVKMARLCKRKYQDVIAL